MKKPYANHDEDATPSTDVTDHQRRQLLALLSVAAGSGTLGFAT